jgi:hypothetical protein
MTSGSGICGPGIPPAGHPQPAGGHRRTAEVRWFVPDHVDVELRPRGDSRRRTDLYHLASLGPESSLKRRNGDGPLERKARVGSPQPCEIAGVPGIAEHWVKRRLRERDVAGPLDGEWIAVHKRLWQVAGVEICRLEIETGRWWTIAVPTGRPNKTMRKVLASWGPALCARGEPASYPMWILSRWREHGAALVKEEAS